MCVVGGGRSKIAKKRDVFYGRAPGHSNALLSLSPFGLKIYCIFPGLKESTLNGDLATPS